MKMNLPKARGNGRRDDEEDNKKLSWAYSLGVRFQRV
jgi:hypothetical protein